MSWLALVFVIQGGLMNDVVGVSTGDLFMPVASYASPEMTTYIELSMEAELFNVIFFGGSIDSRQVPKSIDRWLPHRAIFHIWGGLRLSIFEIGVKHYCDHPVLSSKRLPNYLFGGQTKIYFKITGKIGGKE